MRPDGSCSYYCILLLVICKNRKSYIDESSASQFSRNIDKLWSNLFSSSSHVEIYNGLVITALPFGAQCGVDSAFSWSEGPSCRKIIRCSLVLICLCLNVEGSVSLAKRIHNILVVFWRHLFNEITYTEKKKTFVVCWPHLMGAEIRSKFVTEHVTKCIRFLPPPLNYMFAAC